MGYCDHFALRRIAESDVLTGRLAGRSPLLPFARLRELGFAIILLPVDTLLVGVKAIADFLGEVRKRDDVLSLTDRYMHFSDFNEMIGVADQMRMADRYKEE